MTYNIDALDLPDWSEKNDVDFVLGTLAALAEGVTDQFKITVTLNIPGAIVSGTLVPSKVWADRLLEQVRAASNDESLTESIHTIVEAIPGGHEFGPEDDDVSRIHLVDTHFITGQGNLPTSKQGFPWRGRLKDVSGWSLGKFQDLTAA